MIKNKEKNFISAVIYVYNNENEKDDIFVKLDKIVLPVLQKEKDTYDRN